MSKHRIVYTIIILFAVQNISAQQINNVFGLRAEEKNSIMINFELDPALSFGLAYNRSFDINIGGVERRVETQIGWKSYQFNYNDLNLNFMTTLWNNEMKYNAIVNIGVENKYLENYVHKANIYNWVVSIMPGYFEDQWYVGTEIMYKRLFRAKFNHTEYYKNVFPDVKDGWYSYSNAYMNISLNLGMKITDNADFDFRIGYRFTDDFKNYEPYLIPYFSNLAINYRI